MGLLLLLLRQAVLERLLQGLAAIEQQQALA
jgi:hypothetical protein